MRFSEGEIDIVALDGAELVFVEVKTRRSTIHALPEDSIDDERMAHLEGAVTAYLERRGSGATAHRIEFVAIEVDRSGRVSRYEVIEDVGLR